MLVVNVVKSLLTDGSDVWDVRINDTVFSCVTERDAWSLADKIEMAIRKHTNDIVAVRCNA